MVAYMQRPYGPPPGGFLVPAVPRPVAMGAGVPYAGGGMMYAPASPGMHPGAPRPMYPVPGLLMSQFTVVDINLSHRALLPLIRVPLAAVCLRQDGTAPIQS